MNTSQDQNDMGSARRADGRGATSMLEWAVVAHVVIFVCAATWAFGGQADWVRTPLTLWGAIGAFIALATVLQGRSPRTEFRRLWTWLAPVVFFNALVLVAATNPSMSEIRAGGEILLAATGGNPHWPSSARPDLARAALLEFDAIWIAAFNLVLVVRTRRALRRLMAAIALNAAVLAVFGTGQKLTGAKGIYFGAVQTPQRYFFATFVYHNHWAAFVIIMSAICLALATHYGRRHSARSPWHSPAAFWGVALLIMVATVPFSASRSGTLLIGALLVGAGLRWFAGNVAKRRAYNESILPPVIGAIAAAVIVAGAAWYVAGDTISARYRLTKQQITEARHETQTNQRYQLYRDTFRMGEDKPWFGWGMASYPHVFTIYNTRAPIPHFPVFYHDAHSDWLQAFAEHGVVGCAALAAAALVPLASVLRRRRVSSFAMYLLAGCGLILAYAWFEFPFGNYAVVLCWWTAFYAALQYLRIPRDATLPEGSVAERARS